MRRPWPRAGSPPPRPRTSSASPAGNTPGGGRAAMAGPPPATWSPSTPASSPAATSARSGAPCRSGGAVTGTALAARCDRAVGAAARGLPPGAPASDLLEAYDAAGEPLPPMPVARGLGLGFDQPVVTARAAADRARGAPRARHGARRHRLRVRQAPERPSVATPVLITGDGPEVLTSQPRHLDPINVRSHRDRRRNPAARRDRPLREGPGDQDRHDHPQPARPAERADHRGAAALRRPAAPGEHRRRREGARHPGRGRRLRHRRGPAASSWRR